MYAIVDIKGFQYRLKKGDCLRVPSQELEVGATVSYSDVMLVSSDDAVLVGAPFVDGAVVEAVVTEQGKDDKILVFKKKRRKDYSVKRGHRQPFTEIKVTDISVGRKKKAVKPRGKAVKKQIETAVKDVKAKSAEKIETTDTPVKAVAKKPAKPRKKAVKKPRETAVKGVKAKAAKQIEKPDASKQATADKSTEQPENTE